jgi:hypothetical protein
MTMRAEDAGGSKGRPVTGRIGKYFPARKGADFWLVFRDERVRRTSEGGKANERNPMDRVCVLQRFIHKVVIEPLESFKRVSSRQFVAGSDQKTFEGLEPCAGKLACTVLRGAGGSDAVRLLDKSRPLALTGVTESILHSVVMYRDHFSPV